MDKKLQDLAWSVLPKEFKEEVKRKFQLTDADCIAYEILIDLFGIHNLTSDAEGEEMLTVPRSKVQEQYALNTNALREGNLTDMQTEIAVKVKDTLYYLFGSKCLPDEACNIASNVASSEPYVDSSESNTFKYSVGQKVILHFYGGEVSTITEAFNDGSVWNKYKVKALPNHVWNENELDPYEEPKAAEPKFKVGDKVVCSNYPHVWRQVTAIMEDGSYVLDGAIYDVKESDLEPYTEPKEEASKIKPIESKMSVYLATKEEDEEFRLLLHKNGFEWHTGKSLISTTFWSSRQEETKIYYLYPDKTVTYYREKTSDTLTFSEFKKQYFEENVNLSQETANCDNHFDNILKDCFSKERRLNIASMIIASIMGSDDWSDYKGGTNKEIWHNMAKTALGVADALIAEAEKGGQK